MKKKFLSFDYHFLISTSHQPSLLYEFHFKSFSVSYLLLSSSNTYINAIFSLPHTHSLCLLSHSIFPYHSHILSLSLHVSGSLSLSLSLSLFLSGSHSLTVSLSLSLSLCLSITFNEIFCFILRFIRIICFTSVSFHHQIIKRFMERIFTSHKHNRNI